MSQKRVSTKMKAVIRCMMTKGVDLATAADMEGMHYTAAKRAFARQHVKRYYNQQLADVRNNAGQEALLRIIDIAKNSKSDAIRLKANQWVAGVGGISPVTKTQATVDHTHKFRGYEYDEPGQLKDVTPDQVSEGQIVQAAEKIELQNRVDTSTPENSKESST